MTTTIETLETYFYLGEKDQMTTTRSPDSNFAHDNSLFQSSKGILQLNKHALQKRQGIDPLGALWQIPLFYGACGLGSKLGGGIAKKLYPVLFGPLGKAMAPVIPPALVKKFLIKVCPPVGIGAGLLISSLIPVPGT